MAGWRSSFFDRLMPSGQGEFDDNEKRGLINQALLAAAAGMQSQSGFGNGLAAGTQGLLGALKQGADNAVNDRYRKALMQRTMAGMDRNTQLEQLAAEVVGPDNQVDESKFAQYAVRDPQNAKALRDALNGPQTRWQMGRIGDGQGGEIDVLFDPLDPSKIRTIDGQPIGGPQAQGPTGGASSLLGDAAASIAPNAGPLSQAVMAQESGGNPNAVSPKGALGTMQTMPGTLLDPGFGVQPARDRSPAEMERVGKDYLQAMTQKYGLEGGLAAYNWGPGNWEAALARTGGDPRAALATAPTETKKYVPSVLSRVNRGSASSATPMMGRRPAKAPEPKEPSDLERRIAMARSMGATPDEVKRLVLGQAAPSTKDALGGKPLTMGTVNALTKDAGKLSNLQDLSGRFQDDFAGNTIIGSAENLAGRLGLPGATEGQADWWQQYDRYKNEVRNELFGASLTAGEQAAFKAADVEADMAPDRIKANLKKQAEIIEKGLRRKGRVWAAQGYNKDAIQEAVGIPLDEPGALQPGAVQDGYRFKGGNPADRNSWEKM